MFKQILAAIKFTPASRFALQTGVQLAKIHGAELHVLHALDYRLKDADADDPMRISAEEAAQHRFESDIKPLVGDLETVSFQCLPGDPAMSVCRIARQIEADLIILGCHQQAERISLGRVDYVGITILEKAHCPVMLIPYAPAETA